MFQRDTMFYSNQFKLNYVKSIIAEYDIENNKDTLIKLRDANYGRFKRYFDFFDFYFKNRVIVSLEDENKFNNKFNLNHDFIVMSNLCSLIETYYQFINGSNYSPYKQTVKCYIKIFELLGEIHNCYTKENAEKFYYLIRNGLIHQTNTRINAALSDSIYPIFIEGDYCFLCNTELIYLDLKESINKYFDTIPSLDFNHKSVLNLVKKTKFILNLL